MFDVKKATDEATVEIAKEKAETAKKRIKEKLVLIDKAKKVVSNLERELDDLYDELGQN